MPLYLINVMHLPLKEIAMFARLPFPAADFGCVAGGFGEVLHGKDAHDHDQCASL